VSLPVWEYGIIPPLLPVVLLVCSPPDSGVPPAVLLILFFLSSQCPSSKTAWPKPGPIWIEASNPLCVQTMAMSCRFFISGFSRTPGLVAKISVRPHILDFLIGLSPFFPFAGGGLQLLLTGTNIPLCFFFCEPQSPFFILFLF